MIADVRACWVAHNERVRGCVWQLTLGACAVWMGHLIGCDLFFEYEELARSGALGFRDGTGYTQDTHNRVEMAALAKVEQLIRLFRSADVTMDTLDAVMEGFAEKESAYKVQAANLQKSLVSTGVTKENRRLSFLSPPSTHPSLFFVSKTTTSFSLGCPFYPSPLPSFFLSTPFPFPVTRPFS